MSDPTLDAARQKMQQDRERFSVLQWVRRARNGLEEFENLMLTEGQVNPQLLMSACADSRAALFLWENHPDSKVDG